VIVSVMGVLAAAGAASPAAQPVVTREGDQEVTSSISTKDMIKYLIFFITNSPFNRFVLSDDQVVQVSL
jgi:hypothetical protein